MSNAPVLLVDANRDGLDLYATALALAGIDTDVACSAAEAISLIKTGPPQVLVTGLRLPGTGGAELIAHARQHAKPGLFIVALTTNAALDGPDAQTAGCDLVLPVPCLPETLVHQLQRVLH